ncbi:choice-of-anchor D domain-containing protein [Corallococcus sp. AB011P]|uniref:choice-of-anchor D domain-containing protein n=1 Tax=Corallococcus sp. AB011P TaxID=2316735 RepID=UPI000EA081E3|nr:choice-of-anchor D domain-containing protein [Corallococcus sp. AB011P]RKG56029.1 choice-of-anchor D domain-containing protein [Corallococcus sp. AB011P]
MQRILYILTAALCVLTACGPEAEKPPTVADSRDTRVQVRAAALRPDDPVPSLELNDYSIGFDPQAACMPQENSLTLTNAGTTDRKIYRASITGGFTFNGVYGATGPRCDTNCNVPPTPVNGTGAMTVRVGFAPVQPGNFNGTLTLYTDDPVAPVITVTLTGTATGPLIVVGQTSVAFGAHELGSSPPPRNVTVMNLGNEPFALAPSVTAPFSVSAAIANLAPATSTTLAVTFAPLTHDDLGSITRTLFLTSASTACATPPSVTLTGMGLAPAELGLSHTALVFNETQPNATSAAKEVTVWNKGDSVLNVTQLKLPANSPFHVTPSGAFSLVKGETQRLTLTFRPTTVGSWDHHPLTFVIDNTDGPTISLTCSTPVVSPPTLVLSPAVMAFPQTPLNTDSAPQEVTLRNEGGSPLNVTELKLTSGAAFRVDTLTAFSVAPGETRRVKVTFRPVAPGGASDTLVVKSNIPDQSLTLSGSAPSSPKLVLIPDELAFEETPFDTDSAPKEVTVTNGGDSLLQVTKLTLPANSPFRVNVSGTFNLAPGGTQRLQLTFHPTETSATTGKLTFTSNDPAPPELKLSGTKAPGNAHLTLSPASFEFAEQEAGDVGSEQKKVTVTNTGTVSLTVTPVVTTGSSAYSVSPTTAFPLAPGGTRELFITFNPGASENGAVNGVLTFGTSPTTSAVFNAPLHGTARKTSLEISTSRLDFREWTVGDAYLTEQVILTNNTNWPIKVFPVSPGVLAPFTISGIPAEGRTIERNGGTGLVTVTFAATTPGTYSKTLQLQTDASQSLPPVAITGQALAPNLELEEGTLELPTVAPGGESMATAKLFNTGNQALFLSRITPESAAHFQVVDFLPQTIQPGGDTTVKVRLRPMTSTGNLETRLHFFTTNDRQLPPVLVVKGKSSGPNAIFGVDSLDFESCQVNATCINDKSLSLTNAVGASEPLRVTSIAISPSVSAFSVDPIPATEPKLDPGSTRQSAFKVSFRPTEVGRRYQDNLVITYKGVDSGVTTTRTFPLSGLGADAELSAAEDAINFPATLKDSISVIDIVIKNSGKVEATLESVTVSPSNGFLANVEGWPLRTIPKGGERKIRLTFNPTTSTGSYSAQLQIKLTTTPTGSFALVRDMTGEASIAKLELSSSQVVFGEVPRRTTKSQIITLRNIGSARLKVSNVEANEPFSVTPVTTDKTFPLYLDKNGEQKIEVSFRPETTQPTDAVLTVHSDSDESTELPIYVSGRGTVPVLALPGGRNPKFPPQTKDVEGTGLLQVVRNDGKADLVVSSVSVAGEFCLRPEPEPNPKPSDCPLTFPGFTVKPGETYSFNVAAKPIDKGTRKSLLTIVSNAETTPDTVNLEVESVGSVSMPSTVVDFGQVNFGSSVDKLVTVDNSGITAANVSVQFDSGSSEFSMVDSSLQVPAGQTAQLKLRFRPLGTTGGRRTATGRLNVQGASQVPFTVSGTATSVRLEVSRQDGETFDGALDFGATRVNTKSDFIRLRLTHVGPGGSADAGTDGGAGSNEGLLTIKSISLEGEDARSFILGGVASSIELAKGGFLDVPLQFNPDSQRRFNAVLRITSDDSQSSTTLVTLGGRGRTNQLSLSTPTLEFGARVAESSASAIRSVRITNESLQPLKVKGMEIIGVAENSEPSHYSVESATTLTLAAQESKDIIVKFVPRPDVTSRAALLIVTDDIESPEAQVSLSGRGLSTVFRALNRALDFGTVRQAEPATAKVVLTNDSTQELVLMQPKVEGPQATSFVVVSPILGAEGRTLPQGDSLTLDLKYDTSVIGAAKATLVLGTKDQERAALVALSGVSVASFLTIEPFELDLGWVDIGATSAPRTVTLTNQSASPARLSVVENTNAAFVIDASALDAELAPGAQTTVGVTFRGEVGGPAEGTLKLRLRGETTAEATLTLKGQARTLGGTGGGCACGTSGDGGAALALLLLLGLGLARQGRRAQERG